MGELPAVMKVAPAQEHYMRVLVVQRQSNVAQVDFSLSVSARVTEVLDYLSERYNISYVQLQEHEISDEILKTRDVVFFNKHLTQQSLAHAKCAKKLGCKVLYDIDDYIFKFPEYSGKKQDTKAIFEEFLQVADYVTVANERLLKEVLPYRNDTVLLPNGLFIEKYLPVSGEERTPPAIIFCNADALKIKHFKGHFLTLIQNFFRKNSKIDFDFYGDQIDERICLPFMHYTDRIPYSEYLHCLAAAGYMFAIVPLGANEDEESFRFNSCKNPFKYLNYGAMKIPGIYSKTPIYLDVIEDGRTGLLVDNTQEAWKEAMTELCQNKELRAHIRKNAFDDIAENWHIRKQARVLMDILGITASLPTEGRVSYKTHHFVS